MSAKHFILDTNVLLADPEAIYSYPDAHLVLPLSVLEELDRFKREYNERGRNARLVSLILDQLRKEGSLTEGVKLPNGSILQVLVESPHIEEPLRHQRKGAMLGVALGLKQQGHAATLVTNDINLRVRAAALELEVASHEEKAKRPEDIYGALEIQRVEPGELATCKTQGYWEPKSKGYWANQNIILQAGDQELLLRFDDKKNHFQLVPAFEKGVWGLKAKNLEQQAALDLLMDPSVPLVTLAGKAGTGKTLLALAAALELMLKVGAYQKILVSRPIFPMGRDMGYLPGDIDEKMAPWMQPIFDNLEFLFASNPKMGSYERLQDKGLIELEPLTYIRGRSIPQRIMIVDEAQNLTPHEIKTIVTRVGESTKLILTGDPYQIDNPYIDPNSNGLSYIIQKFQDFQMAGHVTLLNGVRSPLAELASNIL